MLLMFGVMSIAKEILTEKGYATKCINFKDVCFIKNTIE